MAKLMQYKPLEFADIEVTGVVRRIILGIVETKIQSDKIRAAHARICTDQRPESTVGGKAYPNVRVVLHLINPVKIDPTQRCVRPLLHHGSNPRTDQACRIIMVRIDKTGL